MRITDSTWKKIVSAGDYFLDTKLVIGNKEYTSITAPKISRKAVDKPLFIGDCFSASMNVSIVTDDLLDASVPIVVKSRVVNDDEASGYISFGTFYIDNREKNFGMLTLNCFDSMLKANQPYLNGNESESDWPKSMIPVVYECADKIGIEIDARTNVYMKDGLMYVVPYPKDLTVLQVLGYIGACFGGNWIVTEENKLRLIPVISCVDSVDTVNVPVVLESLTTGEEMTVSGISIDDGSITYERYAAEIENGKRVTAGNIPYMCQSICDNVYKLYINRKYQPFSASKTYFDPAAELGDRVVLGNKVDSFLMCAELTLDKVFYGGISAPDCEELESEYPYPSKFDAVKADANKYTDDAVKNAIKETAENTNNMAVALGYYKTTQADSGGGEYTYYHNFPRLSDSTYIFYFGGNGMLWANKWGGSHDKTVWTSSVDSRGNMVMETVSARKITADMINVTELSALSATIGGFYIAGKEDSANGFWSNSLSSIIKTSQEKVDSDNPEYAVFLRGQSVGEDGKLHGAYMPSNIVIGIKKRTSLTQEWKDAEYTYSVSASGKLIAKNAEITGKITATSGSFECTDGTAKTVISNGEAKFYTTVNSDIKQYGIIKAVADGNTGSADPMLCIQSNATNSAGVSISASKNSWYIMYKTPIQDNEATSSTAHCFYGNMHFKNSVYTAGTVYTSGNFVLCGNTKYLYGTTSTATRIPLIGISSGNNVVIGNKDAPNNLNIYTSNTINLLANTIKANSTTLATTSDRRVKKDILPLDEKYERFFKALEPVRFKYKDGQSGRFHMGFIAQDVLKALESSGLTSMDFAGYVKTESENKDLDGYELALRYEEFIALVIYILKKCLKEIQSLKAERI